MGKLLNKLTQTVYDLNYKLFIETKIVKSNLNVETQYGSFTKALLNWYSNDQDGQDPITQTGQILLYNKTCSADYASAYDTYDTTIERYLEDPKNFKLDIADFKNQVPIALQVYYLFNKNDLKILTTYQSSKRGIYLRIVRCKTGTEYQNLSTSLEPQIVIKSNYSQQAVCKCQK